MVSPRKAALVLLPALAGIGIIGLTAPPALAESGEQPITFTDIHGYVVNCMMSYGLTYGAGGAIPNSLNVSTSVTGGDPECSAVGLVQTEATVTYFQQSDGQQVTNQVRSSSGDVAGFFLNVKNAKITSTHDFTSNVCDPEQSQCQFHATLTHPK